MIFYDRMNAVVAAIAAAVVVVAVAVAVAVVVAVGGGDCVVVVVVRPLENLHIRWANVKKIELLL